MKPSSSRGAAFCGIAISLLLCSCKEHAAIFAEKEALEAELLKTKQEFADYDAKIGSVGQPLHTAILALESQSKTAEKTSAELNVEITELTGKSARLGDAIKKFRPLVESYKTKYLR